MRITRGEFLRQAGGALAGALVLAERGWAEEIGPKLKLSACDWSLRAKGPDGLEIARRVGLDGLEVSAGRPPNLMRIADLDYRQQYKNNVVKTGVVISSVAMGLLNGLPLATEPDAPLWLEQTIDAARDFGAENILVAFFGKGDLRTDGVLQEDKVDMVVERLKDAAPKAEEAGVVLGIENTLSAKDNLAILDRVKSDNVRVYYDIRNSTSNGYDVPTEIRELGDRLCQIHFKDGEHYLGEGIVKMEPVRDALEAIDYRGWIVLETSIPSEDRDADFRRNAEYVRKLMGIT